MTDKTIPAPKRPRRMAREPMAEAISLTAPLVASVVARPQSKASMVEGLLMNVEGASLPDLCLATGWLPHTCRAFLTGLRKKRRPVERDERDDGTTIYRLAALKADA